MPLIDLQCFSGAAPGTLSVRPPAVAQAVAYADRFGVEVLCFVSWQASSDLEGGATRLAETIATDARFRGWLTLSPHQPDQSQELARQYLTKSKWVGARFEQADDADSIATAGGREVLNACRRYSCPVLITASTPATLAALVAIAKEFHTLKFLFCPQTQTLTSNAIAAIKETVNVSLLPSVIHTERGVVEQAIEVLGERRVLWGSDWGLCQPTAAIGMMKDSALTATQRERMTWRNARDLLGS
jgi:predicted TIM-barrel fold metal-dependent hydrolase